MFWKRRDIQAGQHYVHYGRQIEVLGPGRQKGRFEVRWVDDERFPDWVWEMDRRFLSQSWEDYCAGPSGMRRLWQIVRPFR